MNIAAVSTDGGATCNGFTITYSNVPSSAHPWASGERLASPGRAVSTKALAAAESATTVQTANRRPSRTHASVEKDGRDLTRPRGTTALMNGTRWGTFADASNGCAARRSARVNPASLRSALRSSPRAPATVLPLLVRRAVLGSRIPRYPTRKEHEQEVPRNRRADGNPDHQPLRRLLGSRVRK